MGVWEKKICVSIYWRVCLLGLGCFFSFRLFCFFVFWRVGVVVRFFGYLGYLFMFSFFDFEYGYVIYGSKSRFFVLM